MLQKYNVEEYPTDPAPPPLSSSLSLFYRLQLELTRTRTRRTRTRTRWTRTRSRWSRGRTRRTRGILSTRMKNWNPSFDSVEEIWSPGARGSGFIVPSSEFGPLDQTDIDWTVILDPLGQWSNIPKESPDWTLVEGGRPGKEGGRPVPESSRPPLRSRGFWSLLDDRKLCGTLISLCKPNVWAFLPYFLITPWRNRQTPKLVEFCQIKP